MRQKRSAGLKNVDPQELTPLSAIVFVNEPPPSIRSRTRRDASDLGVHIIPGSEHNSQLPRIIVDDSVSEYDVEAQGKKAQGEIDPFSPFYSPLETRKQMGALLQVQEPEQLKGGFFDFWKCGCTP